MIGKLLGNRYEILNKIGEGGMAVVYTAKCTLLNRIVAIKILKSEFAKDEEFLVKFKNEAQSAAMVNHPNIVNVYDVGQDGDLSYIVMEYVDGKNLKDLIKLHGKVPEVTALDITEQIAKALQVAHNKGIVHRDIKSHNIMLTSNNLVKVGDFGIAKAVSSATITAVGSIMGSVHYFSPEQARGGYVDERSDIYSLGIVLFEMLTGRLPFDGETPVNIALKQIQENIKFSASDEIRPEIQGFISKLTQKSPDRRYKSAGEVIEEIEHLRGKKSKRIIKEPEKTPVDIDSLDEEMEEKVESSVASARKTVVEVEDVVKEKKGHKVTFIAILLAFLCSLLAVGGFMLLGGLDGIGSIFNQGGKTVVVINFKGLTLEEAKTKGDELGIEVVQAGTEVNSNYSEGTIASQDPSEGVKVKKGDTIRVVISSSSTEEVDVPNVKGYSLTEAKKILENVGLSAVSKTDSSEKPKDEVISQIPDNGTKVKKGELIQLVISAGITEPVKDTPVPNIVGKSVDEARKILAGFTITESYREDKNKGAGVILSQTPAGGEKVEANATINIVINRIEKRPNVSDQLLVMLPTNTEGTVTVKVVDKSTGEVVFNSEIDPKAVDGVLKVNISGEQGQSRTYSVYVNGSSSHDQEVTFQ